MSIYADVAANAARIIAEKGTTLSFYRFTNTIAPVAGTVTVTATEQEVSAVTLPISSSAFQALVGDNSLKELSLVAEKKRYALVAGLGLTLVPKPTDIFYFENTHWLVVGVTPLNVDQQLDIIHKVGMVNTNLSTEQIAAIAAIV